MKTKSDAGKSETRNNFEISNDRNVPPAALSAQEVQFNRDIRPILLHQSGVDHKKLTFPFQRLDQRLTGLEHARVVKEILA